MARKGEMINEFLLLLNPMKMEDSDKVALYLFQSSSVRDGKRFSMSKPETIMARLGWRNLDRVDEAVGALEREGRAQRGRSESPFDKSKIVGGFFLNTATDAPAQVVVADRLASSPQENVGASLPDGLFGEPKYDLGDDAVADDDDERLEVSPEPPADPVRSLAEREVTAGFRQTVSTEVCDLICARPWLRHLGFIEESKYLDSERLRALYVKYAGEGASSARTIAKLIANEVVADWEGRYEAHRSNAA